MEAVFYLPAKNNRGFKIDLGYQYQEPTLLYRFNSNFSFPRGVERRTSDQMFKLYGDYEKWKDFNRRFAFPGSGPPKDSGPPEK